MAAITIRHHRAATFMICLVYTFQCVCDASSGAQKSPSAALERRAYSVMLLLSWRGPIATNGERERADVDASDSVGRTPIHYAAASGLRRCAEYLVAHGEPDHPLRPRLHFTAIFLFFLLLQERTSSLKIAKASHPAT